MNDYEKALTAAHNAAPDGEAAAHVAALLKLYRRQGIAEGRPIDASDAKAAA